jgi:hypothetical protein
MKTMDSMELLKNAPVGEREKSAKVFGFVAWSILFAPSLLPKLPLSPSGMPFPTRKLSSPFKKRMTFSRNKGLTGWSLGGSGPRGGRGVINLSHTWKNACKINLIFEIANEIVANRPLIW